ncbi:hypothetical protein DENSPDRAFT_846090 [Dentipellis sp. KUC8613]|nr:hypothetical protein DENSPDRAFT_846090 [Dentipellis sp. KUC8613]
MSCIRNERYFAGPEAVVFQVENELFRVHRRYLQDYSIVFESMFSLPLVGMAGEGTCDENPIHICVSVLEFETFVDGFYNPDLFGSNVYFTPERSAALRRIADYLLVGYDDLVPRMNAVETRLVWIENDARRCAQWNYDPSSSRHNLQRLVQRPRHLSGSEVGYFGFNECALEKIVRAREEICRMGARERIPFTPLYLRRVVARIFDIED